MNTQQLDAALPELQGLISTARDLFAGIADECPRQPVIVQKIADVQRHLDRAQNALSWLCVETGVTMRAHGPRNGARPCTATTSPGPAPAPALSPSPSPSPSASAA